MILKILMVTDGMDIGGCETHIYELSRTLVRWGHEVALLCSGGRFADMLSKEGVRILYAPTNKRDPISLLVCAWRLRRILREHFDVVHTHTRGMSTLVHFLCKTPHTVTVHLDFPIRGFERRLCHFGDSTLAVSEDICEYLTREYRKKREDILLTYNGIDTEHFAQMPMGGDIVHLSRLDRDRSLCACLLCEVAPLILKDNQRRIHIFGDGDDALRVRKMAKRANALLGREGVVLHGKTEDIKSALALGDIFVGVSRALLEGMACGRACVVCGNEGYGGILGDENVSSLRKSNFCARGFEMASAKKLSVDLLYLFRHEEVRARCGAFCREVAETHYRVAGMAEDALLAYRRAIEEGYRSVLLIGYFGEGNFGDEVAKEHLLSLFSGRDIYLSSKKEYQKREGVVTVSRYFGVLRAMRKVRTIVFGGGTLFQNSTSNRSLLYYTLLAKLGAFLGRRVVMLGGGVDTVRGRFGKQLCRSALRAFDVLTLRTEGDANTVRSLGIYEKCAFLPDLMFFTHARERKKTRRCVLVLKGESAEEEAIHLYRRLTSVGYRVTLGVLFVKEDLSSCKRISDKTGADLCIIREEKEALRLFGKCDFVISMRLHGAISALLSHTIACLYSGSEKNRKLIHEVAKRAIALGTKTPLYAFSSLDEFTISKILFYKKEAVGNSYGFGKLISFYREKLTKGFMLLQQGLLQEQPWEPSSCLREQRHPQEPLLPWTFRERLP